MLFMRLLQSSDVKKELGKVCGSKTNKQTKQTNKQKNLSRKGCLERVGGIFTGNVETTEKFMVQ